MDAQDIIFSYQRNNAWNMLISRVQVINQEKDNLICEKAIEDAPSISTLPHAAIDQIAAIISNDECLATIDPEDLDDADREMELDGYNNSFTFWCKGKAHSFAIRNASYAFRDKAKDADYILEKFDQIARILTKNGVDVEYLKL